MENKKWERLLDNKKQNYVYSIENIKYKTDYIEEKIKLKEKYLRNAGGIKNYPEESKALSNFKLDAIKAKLAVLDKLSF